MLLMLLILVGLALIVLSLALSAHDDELVGRHCAHAGCGHRNRPGARYCARCGGALCLRRFAA
ncbi:MAG: hypothetical protein AB1716_07960 [Planctomycetota bacterium]